jgi:predicted branched-subunit amino acid permease
MSYGITDEIFGVSSGVRGRLRPQYTFGLIAVAVPGWTIGTLIGVLMGGVLPMRLVSAFSVALYGMFIAIIVPPAKGNRVLACVVVAAMAASAVFEAVPALADISPGFRIIILTVAIAGIAAALFPVKEEDGGR